LICAISLPVAERSASHRWASSLLTFVAEKSGIASSGLTVIGPHPGRQITPVCQRAIAASPSSVQVVACFVVVSAMSPALQAVPRDHQP